METAINPLLTTTRQHQPGLSAHAAELFSIDSSAMQRGGPGKDPFSSMLQEKIERQRAEKAERADKADKADKAEKAEKAQEERNKLPSSGKEAPSAMEREVASAAAAEQAARERDVQERQARSQQEVTERSAQQQGAKESPAETTPAADANGSEEEESESVEQPALLLAEEGEGDSEGLLAQQQPVTPLQEETPAVVVPPPAAQQQAAAEEPVELDEMLLEEEMLKRASAEQGRGRGPGLPPELQRGEQPPQSAPPAGEEMDLKSFMQALREQHAGLPAGESQAGGGAGGFSGGFSGGNSGQGGSPGQGAGAQPLSSLFSASDPLNGAERPAQLKGMTATPQSRQWSSELGERILFMAGQKIQSAEIRLNPPNLGLLEVKLAISGDQAQLVFQSGNASVRDVLESAVPRIREMLEQQGINLTDVNVSDGKQQQSAESEEGAKRGGAAGGLAGMGLEGDDEVVPIATMAVGRIGLVDYYI